MGEMLDRVARAIAKAEHGEDFNFGIHWAMNPPNRSRCEAMARAAIEAMRSPPEAILDALNRRAQCEGFIPEGWNDAINAMLANG